MDEQITIVSVGPDEADLLYAFVRALEGESSNDPGAAERAVADVQQSRKRFDFLNSDSFWTLVAVVGGTPVGYAAVCRIPKADVRAGFLFVDELHVLQSFRRRGVATALLKHTVRLADELGLAGVRLLVRPENKAARHLYRAAGFSESPTLFCQRVLGNHSDERREQS